MTVMEAEDGTELAYERRGDGPPLIFLHGGMAPREYWNAIVPHFESFGAILPQRPGFGTCLDDPEQTSAAQVLARETAYVATLVDAVDGTPILFGHSFGALTALETATDAAVRAVLAYEPAILPDDFRERADLADRMEGLIEDGQRREAVKEYIKMVLHPDGITDLETWLETWPVWPECVDLAEEVVRMNRAVERYELPTHLDVDAPVLLMSGTDGPDFLRQSARDVHDALPHSRFVEFDGVSHSGPGEAPALISAEVTAFLDG